jgi:hypothetical protein
MIAADIWAERTFRPVVVRRRTAVPILPDDSPLPTKPSEPPQRLEPGAQVAHDVATGLPADAELRQQMTRFRTAAGEEIVSGLLHAELMPGDRSGFLHIAFCPPLASIPELHLEQAGGPAARIKAAQVQPYGARIEYRLNDPLATRATLAIEFTALEIPQSADAPR